MRFMVLGSSSFTNVTISKKRQKAKNIPKSMFAICARGMRSSCKLMERACDNDGEAFYPKLEPRGGEGSRRAFANTLTELLEEFG
jgi:hypothetical protein